MSATRPLNFGLTDALSRIGGWSRPELPALLDGIQGVVIYGDVSKSVASEVFEARAVSGVILGNFIGIELQCQAAGGLVIEELYARMDGTGGIPALGLNIALASGGAVVNNKLDVGGIPTSSTARTITNTALPVGAILPFIPILITGGGATNWRVETRTRIWVPPGAFFQAFPAGFASISNTSVQLAWRELADVQGAP